MPKGGKKAGGGGKSVRLTLMVNGDPHKSHILMGVPTLDTVAQEAVENFKEISGKAKRYRVFDTSGHECSDSDLKGAKNGDIVFVSCGEDFIPPQANRAMGKKKMKKAGGMCYSTNASFMTASSLSQRTGSGGGGGGGGGEGGGGEGGGGGGGGGKGAAQYTQTGDGVADDSTTKKVIRLLGQRVEAKKAGEFQVADSLRQQLRSLGVTVDDKTLTWKLKEKRSDPADGEHGHDYVRTDEGGTKVALGKVHRLLAARLAAKRTRDFDTADKLKAELTQLGVFVDDKMKTWQMLGAQVKPGGMSVASGGAGAKEEWQRLPKEMLQKASEKEGFKGKPQYQVLHGTGQRSGREYLCRCVLADKKSRQVVYPSALPSASKEVAEQLAALSALYNLIPNAPREKLLPEPYRTAWLNFPKAPPPGKIEKKVEANPDARDRTVSQKSDYQEVHMSEANRMFVESVIKRALARRADATAGSAPIPVVSKGAAAEEEAETLLGMGWKLAQVKMATAGCGLGAAVPELLDWLCLNTSETELPSGFAAQMRSKVEVWTPGKLTQPLAGGPEPEPEFAGELPPSTAKPAWEEPAAEAEARRPAAGGGEAVSGLWQLLLGWAGRPVNGGGAGGLTEEEVSLECNTARELGAACGVSQPTVVAEAASTGGESWEDDVMEPVTAESFEEDEFMVLQSIYGEDDCSMCTADSRALFGAWVGLNAPALGPLTLQCWIQPGSAYPHAPPVMVLRGPAVGSAELLATVTKNLAVKAAELTDGEPLIYRLVQELTEDDSWLLAPTEPVESLAPKEGPGSAAVSEVSEAADLDTVDDYEEDFADAFEVADAVGTKPLGSAAMKGSVRPGVAMKQFRAGEEPKPKLVMKVLRERLPSFKKREDILGALASSQVVVVTGETGCGKTTQVPQFIMEQTKGECFIVCTRVLLRRMQTNDTLLDGASAPGGRPAAKVTHVIVDEVHERSLDSDHLLTLLRDMLPRRPDLKVILMSATINAERFAGYFNGCQIQHIPGFTHPVEQYWLEDVLELTRHRVRGKIGKLTDDKGKLTEDDMRELQRLGGYSQQTMDSLKSATGEDEEPVDALLVAKLVISLSERVLADAARAGAKAITGAILVFLPGLRDIRGIHDILSTGRGRFRGSDLEAAEAQQAMQTLYPLMLHSTVPPKDQAKVFQRPPKGLVKVVLSTNIAETSITIDDVVCVVDTLRVNQTGYDPVNRVARLEEQWCSQAAHRQRAGRAGRVRAGECWSLVTKKRHGALEPFEQPEIFRVPLDQLYLKIESSLSASQAAAATAGQKKAGRKGQQPESAREVLLRFMDPPPGEAMNAALESLKEVGALDSQRRLSALGHHLAYLPIDLRLAKVLLFGAIFRCVDPAATIAACIGAGRSPMLSPPDKRAESREAHKQFIVRHSDHLTLLQIYAAWERTPQRERRRWCGRNFLSDTSLTEIQTLRRQLLAALQEMGFLTRQSKSKWNQHAHYPKLVTAVVCAGLYPRIIRVQMPKAEYQDTMAGAFLKQHQGGLIKYYIQEEPGRVFIHPGSVFADEREHANKYLVYFEKAMTSKLYIRDATYANPYSLLLFGGEVDVQHEQGTITVDGWVKYKAAAKIAVLAKSIRGELDRLLLHKISRPEVDITGSQVISAIVQLLVAP